MTDNELKPLVDACEHYVLRNGTESGITRSCLGAQGSCHAIRKLGYEDQSRVQILLAKRPTIGTSVGRNGGLTFYPHYLAPKGALNVRNPRTLADIITPLLDETEGKVIARAIERT